MTAAAAAAAAMKGFCGDFHLSSARRRRTDRGSTVAPASTSTMNIER